jgi:hypothetical protein
MCNICYANSKNIHMIDSNPSTMCDEHYQDWSAEKSLGENW